MTAERDRNTQGIDVNISEEILARSPHCRHGPTLLFEKFTGKGEVKRYFACSAFRDHKQCRFYQPLTGEESLDNFRKRKNDNEQKVESKDHIEKYSRYQRAKLINDGNRHYCHSCHLLVFKEELNLHTSHVTISGIPDWLLQLPTRLMAARENNKSQAQYLFSQQTTEFLVQTIKSLGFNRVLCVGVPRLHEILMKERDKLKIDSLLLDIDERFAHFYRPSEFCCYNMFNHYFFDNSSKAIYESFLQRNNGGGIVLVMDPPFGGLVDALAFGVSQIAKSWNRLEWNKILPVMWIFPYFMERRIISLLPTFTMLDYKVEYDNHSHFKNGCKSKKKSPVRIFTNISPASIVLPPDEGYRFCSKCQRYSAADNPHCKKCNKCASKDGSTYRHCSLCHRCVKPSYSHCKVCRKCELPSHDCKRVLTGCHLCGDLHHKRKECPQLSSHTLRFKLPLSFTSTTSPSKTCVSMEVDNNLSQLKGYRRKRRFPNQFVKRQKNALQRVSRKEAHTNIRSKTMIEEYVRQRRLKRLKSTFCLNHISANEEDRR